MNYRSCRIPAMVLLMAVTATGCSGGSEHKGHEEEEHGEKGPHGGMLFATKDHKYHLELTTDKNHAILYLLDDKAKKAVATKASSFTLAEKGQPDIEFKPDRQQDDPADAASRFRSDRPHRSGASGPIKAEITGSINDKIYHFNPE